MSDTSNRLSQLAARGSGLSHLIDHSPPTLADDLRLAEARGREAARETLRAEGAAAERERVRLELLAEADGYDAQGYAFDTTGHIATALRDFARRLAITASAYVDGQRVSATAGTPEEADAELTRLAGLDHSDLPDECPAILWHGPGHQSRARCRLRGPHAIHETVYGSARQFARWEGGEAFSGVFNEPPPEPKP